MAKKEEKVQKEEKLQKPDLATANEDNIHEQLKNAQKMTQEVLELAEKKDKEAKLNMKAEELNRISNKATYINLLSVLRTRFIRAKEKAISALREDTRKHLNDLKSGVLTPNEYEKAIDESVKEQMKKLEKANEEYKDGLKELRNEFPSGRWYEWEDPFNRLNRFSENNY